MPVFSDIIDLLKETVLPNTHTIIVFEYAYGFIETKYAVANNIDECITFIKTRYKKFPKEKKGYKHIEEEYFEEDNYLMISSHFEEGHTFATRIEIVGINTEQYTKIKKTLVKIFGDCLCE